MPVILNEHREIEVPAIRPGPGLWLGAADLARATGFELKPQGLCKDDICVPARSGEGGFVDEAGHVDVAAFWRHLGNPVVHDEASGAWALGVGAPARAPMSEAPDFALPDLDGRMHALADYRGRKVFLATWASW